MNRRRLLARCARKECFVEYCFLILAQVRMYDEHLSSNTCMLHAHVDWKCWISCRIERFSSPNDLDLEIEFSNLNRSDPDPDLCRSDFDYFDPDWPF